MHMLDNRFLVDRVIESLADQLVVERFVRRIQANIKHPQAAQHLYTDSRIAFKPLDFVNRHLIDDIRLSRLDRRNSGRVFLDRPPDDFTNAWRRTPIFLVSSHREMGATLPTGKSIGARADRLSIELVAQSFRRFVA